MTRSVRLLAFLAVLFGVPLGALGQARSADPRTLEPILKVLQEANLSGSMEVVGGCGWEDWKAPERGNKDALQYLGEVTGTLNADGTPRRRPVFGRNYPEFPQLIVRATTAGTPLETLRSMLADEPNIQVTQEADGTIRMAERGIPADTLSIRISQIIFVGYGHKPQRAIYSANEALYLVLKSPEVEGFMKARGIPWLFPAQGIGGAIGGAQSSVNPAERPYISGYLENVTLSQALDHILKAFPGIWYYEDCPANDKRGRFIYFHHYRLRNPGDSSYPIE